MGDKAEKRVVKPAPAAAAPAPAPAPGAPPTPSPAVSPVLTPAKKKEPPPPLLNVGHSIAAGSGNHYLVESMLGKGGFGEVYKVSLLDHPEKKYAMKCELNTMPNKKQNHMLRLKVEIMVFETIKNNTHSESKIDTSHFVLMHDKGKTKVFKFYLMDLIWLSLKDLADGDICKGGFSPSTKVNIARQTLKSIEALHDLGFLHRDIKAANFAVGLPPKENIIYMLDFGICRPYRDPNGGLRVARATVPFMGTPRYASIRSQEAQEQCRKDDLEVWNYMMLEIYDQNNLYWRNYVGKDYRKNALECKKELMGDPEATRKKKGLEKIPLVYCKIMSTIHKMKYADAGDFKAINGFLDELVAAEKIDEKLPLDWVGKKPKSPEKPKVVPIKREESIKKSKVVKLKKEASKMEHLSPEKDESRRGGDRKREDTDNKKKKEASKMEHLCPEKDLQKDESRRGGDRKREDTDRKKKRRKKSRMRRDDDEIDVEAHNQTMEEMIEELKEKKRRKQMARAADDDYWNREGEGSGSEDDYSSEEDDHYRRKGKKSRKRRSREKHRTRDYSDRDDRDERDDRRPRRRSGGRKKSRDRRKTYDDDDEREAVARIPESKNYDDRDRDRRKGRDDEVKREDRSDAKRKEDRPPEKLSKEKEKEVPQDDAYMVLGDINAMEKAQDNKASKEKAGEPKKGSKETPEPEKK